MAESYFSLSAEDRAKFLELDRERTGRPAHLPDMDVCVVWKLGALFRSSVGAVFLRKRSDALAALGRSFNHGRQP